MFWTCSGHVLIDGENLPQSFSHDGFMALFLIGNLASSRMILSSPSPAQGLRFRVQCSNFRVQGRLRTKDPQDPSDRRQPRIQRTNGEGEKYRVRYHAPDEKTGSNGILPHSMTRLD
jgi:hypothetical protein